MSLTVWAGVGHSGKWSSPSDIQQLLWQNNGVSGLPVNDIAARDVINGSTDAAQEEVAVVIGDAIKAGTGGGGCVDIVEVGLNVKEGLKSVDTPVFVSVKVMVGWLKEQWCHMWCWICFSSTCHCSEIFPAVSIENEKCISQCIIRSNRPWKIDFLVERLSGKRAQDPVETRYLLVSSSLGRASFKPQQQTTIAGICQIL